MARDYLPWLLSAITIWMTVLAGNKHRSAWLIGLGNQLLWLVWIVVTGAWGLIPMNVALWIVYARNHLKWQRGFHDSKPGREGLIWTEDREGRSCRVVPREPLFGPGGLFENMVDGTPVRTVDKLDG